MNYQERAEAIKALSEQAYFDAKVKPEPQKKDVRIGSVDGRTGRSQVFHADGGFSTNGIRVFNAEPPSDRFVRGQQSPSINAMALGYRDYDDVDIDAEVNGYRVAFDESGGGAGGLGIVVTSLSFTLFSGDFGGAQSSITYNNGALSASPTSNISPNLSTFSSNGFGNNGQEIVLSLNAPFISLPPNPPRAVFTYTLAVPNDLVPALVGVPSIELANGNPIQFDVTIAGITVTPYILSIDDSIGDGSVQIIAFRAEGFPLGVITGIPTGLTSYTATFDYTFLG